ncbi:hypothetical protein EVAR_25952_1 [Eumeta japonica]|uniref:Histone-lysine N-methyltransferase SETMAR n=1 Tax=Eumeta variegata TaxID=151549 RepID=A0A4C1V1E1_EUMVA|nr:hypothetical protein EVAR_25952_1 [Eumeta japonica]
MQDDNNWFAKFKHGLINLNDEFLDGRPSTAVNNKNMDSVRRMIATDRHVTYYDIRESLGKNMSKIQSILQKQLCAKKLRSRWNPHNLIEAKKTDRVT